MKPAIGVLGTGRMGSALARALLRAGYPTTVWNRTSEKAIPLAESGATVAASVRELIDATQIIIVNVSDYSATSAVLRSDAVAAALPRQLVEPALLDAFEPATSEVSAVVSASGSQ
jgi:3-hydroxyisobutyrate dehydrogenase-like beta-hydroxyacid dehydrogenase